jgi:two-component system copper resistance phosphate regulon response regulator CusR
VIVLDVMLPGADGVSITRRLREDGCTVGILMLTARDALRDRIEGLDAGADDYLPKPFAFSELLARIRALYRRRGIVSRPVLQVGRLRIDTARRRATVAGRTLALSGKEYALLEYLALHAGSVVGRAEISEHGWDDSYDPASNTIDVHVNRLRRELGEPQLIATRRGEGYVLHEDDEA